MASTSSAEETEETEETQDGTTAAAPNPSHPHTPTPSPLPSPTTRAQPIRRTACVPWVHAGKLFARCHARELVCPKAKIFIDFHGNVMAEHVPMAKWDMNKLLLNLRARKLSWRDIYWKVWGIISLLKCSVCGLAFPAADLAHCAFCPSAPTFRPGVVVGQARSLGKMPCRTAVARAPAPPNMPSAAVGTLATRVAQSSHPTRVAHS